MMNSKPNHIVAATLIVLAGLLTAACSSDYDYTPQLKLKLTATDACFSAASQQGLICLLPTRGLTASTTAAWCRAEVTSDSTVVITVERNNAATGRSAEVLLQGLDGGTARVPVTQQGAVWYVMGDSTYLVGDEQTTLTIPLHSDYDYRVDLPQWASGRQVEGAYELTLSPNRTGQVRQTRCTFTSEKGSRTISICQIGPNDLAGTYRLTYGIPVSQTQQRDTTVTISLEQSATDSLQFLASGMSVIPALRIPFTYDPLLRTLSIGAGQLLGRVGSQQYYVYTALASEAGAHTSTSLSYAAPVVVDHTTLMPSFTFADAEGIAYYDSNGDEQTAHIAGILTIGTVQERASIDAGNFLGYADRIMNPRLTKVANP